MNGEQISIWKEKIVAYFAVLVNHLHALMEATELSIAILGQWLGFQEDAVRMGGTRVIGMPTQSVYTDRSLEA